MLTIRNEEPRDYEIVERMTRNSFYNLYIPGCMEHYLVHIMREHKDFIPELDFVLELDNKVVGYIMYTRATLTDEKGNMVIDIGGGTSDIAVVSMGQIVTSDSIEISGDTFDNDIKDHIRNRYRMLIGESSAEMIK